VSRQQHSVTATRLTPPCRRSNTGHCEPAPFTIADRNFPGGETILQDYAQVRNILTALSESFTKHSRSAPGTRRPAHTVIETRRLTFIVWMQRSPGESEPASTIVVTKYASALLLLRFHMHSTQKLPAGLPTRIFQDPTPGSLGSQPPLLPSPLGSVLIPVS